jgi:hydrogenase maturation protein HypF
MSRNICTDSWETLSNNSKARTWTEICISSRADSFPCREVLLIVERRVIAIKGIVQGVGFRPFVYDLATRLQLHGFVRNRTGGVLIEVEGEPQSLDRFLIELNGSAPPLAHIEHFGWTRQPLKGEHRFIIQASEGDASADVFVSPDMATCAECLAEMWDPENRRYRYPFLNCTNCGPRLTIITGSPYDRERTTMARFAMCAACRDEYEDPANRRFHAQPTACANCGPSLALLDPRGKPIEVDDPLVGVVAALRAGKIVAMKGLGGFHLVCDARIEASVAELRRRKHRDEKPFAIMVADISAAEALCEVDLAEKELLRNTRRPIVLLRKRASSCTAPAVAPGNPCLGVMLPFTPLHHLLLADMHGAPLVMTSGNRSDEPIAYEDQDALDRLCDIAQVFLTHDRPIHVRCDDSVTRIVDGLEAPIRRSRGYAPRPLHLPIECGQPTLAVGGQFKGTFALGRGRHAFLSHHLGDLDHLEAFRAFERDIALYEQLFGVRPEQVAHDLHPDYASTRYAVARANGEKGASLRLVPVQHHHAHMCSCMAEHGLQGPVIGVTFDGTGFGTDGTIWGGEFLVGDYGQFHRAAHLRRVGLPGGDQAVREPWRAALAHLVDAAADEALLRPRIPAMALRTVRRMIERRFHTPWTSSAGRLFDAVAALAGLRDRVSFEGQVAMELEWRATEVAADSIYSFELTPARPDLHPDPAGAGPESGQAATFEVDTRPLIREVADDARRRVGPDLIGRRFHSTMVEIIVAVCERLRKATRIESVVLSGGVFMNALLSREASAGLSNAGFRVHRQRLVPPNDGGLSLGQLAIAAAVGSSFGGELPASADFRGSPSHSRSPKACG